MCSLLSLTFHLLCTSCVVFTENVIRQTEYGPVRGFVTERIKGTKVEQYLGVPYAEPPLGKLRFEAPVPPTPWDQTRDATSLSAACIQYDHMEYIQEHMPGFVKNEEDCLYLNIYTPKIDDRKRSLLPVLLYIHGGSNRVGMGSMLEGDILAGQGQIVVVTFNYRLGIFGFLAAKDEGLKGTYGFLDQIEVFKWVKINIRHFGGDPDAVTIHGHSAGAADAGLHLVSPLSKGYFKRAIIHSGSPLAFWAMSDPTWPEGYNVDPKKMHDKSSQLSFKQYMQQRDSEKIRWIVGKGTPRDTITFPAVVDGEFLLDRTENLYHTGKFNGESFLISFARDEGFPINKNSSVSFVDLNAIKTIFENYRPIYPNVCNLTGVLVNEYNEYLDFDPIFQLTNQVDADLFFFAPIIKLARLMAKWTDQLYLFSFDHLSALANEHEWQGIPHGIDLFYVFGVPLVGHQKINYTDIDKAVSRAAMDIYSNFVKSGHLSYQKRDYVTFNLCREVYHRLISCGDNIIMDSMFNLREDKVKFWNDILPSMVCDGPLNLEGNFPTNGGIHTAYKTASYLMICILFLTYKYSVW